MLTKVFLRNAARVTHVKKRLKRIVDLMLSKMMVEKKNWSYFKLGPQRKAHSDATSLPWYNRLQMQLDTNG